MRAVVFGLVAAILAVTVVAVRADSSGVEVQSAQLGERFTVFLEVVTDSGATVEVDPLAPSWNGVEVLEARTIDVTTVNGQDHHRLELTTAAFFPGVVEATPVVMVIDGSTVTRRELPPISLTVPSSLPEGAPLQLVGAPMPESIGGAQSPFLAPAIALAAGLFVLFAAIVFWRAFRRYLRYHRGRRPRPIPPPREVPELPGHEEILRDPVHAYRAMSAIVRGAIARRYGFAATSLTTGELVERMQSEGVDRWQARLVTGLLQNCDAVVYAGYRPAPDRRRADITMAEEILEGSA